MIEIDITELHKVVKQRVEEMTKIPSSRLACRSVSPTGKPCPTCFAKPNENCRYDMSMDPHTLLAILDRMELAEVNALLRDRTNEGGK
jgi:hypothetical protein